ncbi:hypothetical protein GCM10027258_61770 [Amycolatopsis stemonae]
MRADVLVGRALDVFAERVDLARIPRVRAVIDVKPLLRTVHWPSLSPEVGRPHVTPGSPAQGLSLVHGPCPGGRIAGLSR